VSKSTMTAIKTCPICLTKLPLIQLIFSPYAGRTGIECASCHSIFDFEKGMLHRVVSYILGGVTAVAAIRIFNGAIWAIPVFALSMTAGFYVQLNWPRKVIYRSRSSGSADNDT
jgi:hypothetical protein